MIKDGKKLEKLVKLIHETLKDSPNTVIYGNKKVKNTAGNYREFDIFIEAHVNHFPIRIAIECKDYATPVSVEKIEAFQAKCARIAHIHKKVFVAANGYQRDAIQAAGEFGIDLYQIADIDAASVRKWLPITLLGLHFEVIDFHLGLDTDERSLEQMNEPGREAYFVYQEQPANVLALIQQTVFDNKESIWQHAIYNFMRRSDKTELGGRLRLPVTITFNLDDAFITSGDLRLPLKAINSQIDVWLVESENIALTIKDYSTQNESKAKYVEFDNGQHGKLEMVVTSDNFKFFHTDTKGKTTPLENLGSYDPKNDRFTPSKRVEK